VQTVGAKVYATDRLGTIVIQTDGANVAVTPDAPETKDYCAAGASYW
jgi:beta-lactamase superfamily II metal-dependent hydrolase